ncbi:hypothetical protein R6Z07F_003975 [Ovis aries]
MCNPLRPRPSFSQSRARNRLLTEGHLRDSSEVALGPLTSFREAPAAISCAARRLECASAPRPTRRPLPLRPDPRPRPSRERRGSRRDAEAREPYRPSLIPGNAWFGAELALQTSGPGLLPQASPQTASEPSPADQHDHGRAARHLRQHAGRVALPACRSLSLRGCQQSQEAGMRVALFLPQGSRT